MHIIQKIEHHPSPPISLHKDQVESLTEKLNFLLEFLEGYHSPFDYSDEADPLEVRIADAAHAAEDVIETEIVDRIPGRSSTILVQVQETTSIDLKCAGTTTKDHFNEDLEKVIEEMELINNDVKEMVREKAAIEPQFHGSLSADEAGERNSHEMVREKAAVEPQFHGERNNHEMVGCDEVLLQLLDRLAGGESSRQIIPIVGMGGIGKTTLAKTVFRHPLIKDHFDVCVWATISQDYNVKGTLDEVLSHVREKSRDKSEKELGLELRQYLCSRRYFVVMDDVWSLEVWDRMNIYFPEYNNGSRILVTTRMTNLATHLTNPNSILDMKFLDEGSARDLFSKIVFGQENFPVELEGSILNQPTYVNDEFCLTILKTSYNHLPAYLKPCFLYMGMVEEDSSIPVAELIQLWVCEGFLKPINNKSPETIAEEYLKELVDRNLVLVDKLGVLGNMKFCKMHDLVRDLSLKEAQKQRFYHVVSEDRHRKGASSHRRIVVREGFYGKLNANNYMPHARSYYTCDKIELPRSSRLLRTLIIDYDYGLDFFQFVNLRYIDASVKGKTRIPSSISQLWNLHTLIITSRFGKRMIAPMEIWKMAQLRHVEFVFGLIIPNPPSSKDDDDDDIVVMENLHTLKAVFDLELNEEVVKRIPNIKKLMLYYHDHKEWESSRVNGISYLHCLENLYLSSDSPSAEESLQNISSLPHSLKKLTLWVSYDCEFDDMLPKIGSLPLLQKLTLTSGVFRRGKWETSDCQFPSLKFLSLSRCRNLENWTVSESSPFPRLQELRLVLLEGPTLEIHSEIGEIATLENILVHHCSESVVLSAKKIADEQQDLCGDLHVTAQVYSEEEKIALQNLAGPNFQVEVSIF